MKRIIFLVLLITACGQPRAYYVEKNDELEQLVRYSISDNNIFAGCELFEYFEDESSIEVKEKEISGDVIGYWDDKNNQILMDPEAKDLYGWLNYRSRSILLHEIGHSLGYGHIDKECHVMNEFNSWCNSNEEAIQEFLLEIIEDHGCL